MSENAFYPAFLLAAWALVRALETPTLARHAVLLGACGVAVLVRVQAVAIVLAALTAPLLLRAVARVPLRPFLPLYAIVGVGAALVLGAQLARGSSLATLLGAYQVVGEEGYEPVEVLRYLFWHLAELDLYVGVVPFAAFLLLAGRMRSLDGPLQALLAAAVALSVWTLLVVSAFASRFAFAIEERNMFVLVPLLLLALLAWIERGLPRPRLLAGVVAGTAAALPALIPLERFLQLKVRSDTLMLVPLWNLQDEITLPRVDEVLLVAGVAAALAFLLLPRRLAAAFPAAILAYFALATQPIHAGPHGMEQAAAGALFEAVRQQEPDWIDEAAGADEEVAALWTGRTHRFTVNMLEFFNRSVGAVYTLGGPMPGGLPETVVTVDEETGEIVRPDGSVVRADYAYTDGSVALDGQPVAADPGLGLTLYRVGGPLVSTTSVEGVDNDLWSGPEAQYRRVRCRGGTLVVTIGSDPGLHKRRQTVAAFGTRGTPRASVSFRPQETATLRVPLVPVDDVCEVDFRITPTAVPGGGDRRELGVRFLSFEYVAP